MGISQIDKLRETFYCEFLRQDVTQAQCIDNLVWHSSLIQYRDSVCNNCPLGIKHRDALAGPKTKPRGRPVKRRPILACKKCNKQAFSRKDIETLFGYKTYRKGLKTAKTMPQSWCRDCRRESKVTSRNKKAIHQCEKCHKLVFSDKFVEKLFGYKANNMPQLWCRACRAQSGIKET